MLMDVMYKKNIYFAEWIDLSGQSVNFFDIF